jgi:TRAP-type C4-dicarboxylate transport system permease small subunit
MVCQIASRYLLNAPLTWTEELARYLYIWACYLGAAVALRRGTHVSVALFAERLPPALARGLGLATRSLALVFFAALGIQGARLAARSHSVAAITLPIPWSLIYLVVPVAAVVMALETAEAMAGSPARAGDEASP